MHATMRCLWCVKPVFIQTCSSLSVLQLFDIIFTTEVSVINIYISIPMLVTATMLYKRRQLSYAAVCYCSTFEVKLHFISFGVSMQAIHVEVFNAYAY
jgi:hypothetical protein